jgi:hypothetical protein
MRSDKRVEARSVNPVQAQIKSLSGAILTIIDATYADPVQREAVKSLIKAQIRAKLDILTLDWIARYALKLTEPIRTQPFDAQTPVWAASSLDGSPYAEEFTEEERRRLAELEEEVVEVDGVEFSKEDLKEKVVVDGIEFEKEKKLTLDEIHDPKKNPEDRYPEPPAHVQRGRASNDPLITPTLREFESKRHTARANSTAEAEPNPFCSQCEKPVKGSTHTCGKE